MQKQIRKWSAKNKSAASKAPQQLSAPRLGLSAIEITVLTLTRRTRRRALIQNPFQASFSFLTFFVLFWEGCSRMIIQNRRLSGFIDFQSGSFFNCFFFISTFLSFSFICLFSLRKAFTENANYSCFTSCSTLNNGRDNDSFFSRISSQRALMCCRHPFEKGRRHARQSRDGLLREQGKNRSTTVDRGKIDHEKEKFKFSEKFNSRITKKKFLCCKVLGKSLRRKETRLQRGDPEHVNEEDTEAGCFQSAR